MDTLDVGGVTYVKASKAAREAGYTADYVGQLCRGEKIDSQLVGRTWYVKDGVLGEHRKSKARLNKQKTLEAVAEVKEEKTQAEEASDTKVPIQVTREVPAYRKHLLNPEITYSSDQSTDLAPFVKNKEGESVEREPVDIEVRESKESAPEDAPETKVSVKVSHESTKKPKGTSFSVDRESLKAMSGDIAVTEVSQPDTEDKVLLKKKHAKSGMPARMLLSKKRAEMAMEEIETKLETQKSTEIPVKEASNTEPRTFLNIAPVAAPAVAVLLLLSSVFLHGVWVYNTEGGEQLESGFGVAAVGVIADTIR